MPFTDQEIEVIRQIVLEGGEIGLKYQREGVQAEVKNEPGFTGEYNIVTVADRAIETHFKSRVLEIYPNDTFYGEESGGEIGPSTWGSDGVDGTSGFQRGWSEWCTALFHMTDGKPDLSLARAPGLGTTYLGIRGQGAFKIDDGGPQLRLQVSKQTKTEQSLVNLGQDWGRMYKEAEDLQTFSKFANAFRAHRIVFSSILELARIAEGQFDASIQPNQSFWDFFGGWLLIEEAGGKLTNWKGNQEFSFKDRSNNFIASNGLLHDQILKLVP